MKETRSRRRRDDEAVSVDIIPLMDVIFLLLCFFILLTLNMVYQQGMKVNLAEATTGQKTDQSKNQSIVTVEENGQLHLDEQPVSTSQLSRQLSDRRAHQENVMVLINVDRKARHHRIVSAMEAIRSAAVEKVIMTVRPAQ